jgi:DNA repair protein SbcC/Rad50
MRPLRLELKGFTAFRDETEVDFSGLDVFAIAGPTGSGKSSLLDAMTFALYGRVERVGDRVSHLISQGQPRMAVSMDFQVGRDRYRIARSTSAKGLTKIQLMREVDGEWRQAGEGSDRVRDVERMILGTVGLTYDGFTRSVVLPQGRFAEFLVGDPRKRRDILTELLGLSLFKRMAERARAISGESSIRAQTMSEMVDREYADATPESVAAARVAATDAAELEARLGKAGEAVLEILGRWRDAERTAQELVACSREVAEATRSATEDADLLARASQELQAANAEADAAGAASSAAASALSEARERLRLAEAGAGTLEDLTAASARAASFAEAVRARAARASALTERRASLEPLGAAVAVAEAALSELTTAREAAEAELAAARSALAEVEHADLVAAVSAGLAAGDPCPVCGTPLERPPAKASARAVGRARTQVARTERQATKAATAAATAERALDAARRDLEAAGGDVTTLSAEVARLQAAIDEHRAALAAVLGQPVPADPMSALTDRIADLRALDRAERDAERTASDAAEGVAGARQAGERATASIERLGDRLTADRAPLRERVARAGGSVSVGLPSPPEAPATGDPAELSRFADALVGSLRDLSVAIQAELERRGATERELLDAALAAIDGLVKPAESLPALAAAVDGACKRATADAATTARSAKDLAERLRHRKELARDVMALQRRAQIFKRLALELRADRLVAFLQAEALEVLAAAASERMASLSEGRYRLLCRDDEFVVVDVWNGEEERSVRTLSGGETFLASLSLALALSDQVRSLSVTDRSRLDSLFLDEGFGTLDPDTLRVVVDALEQLGGDGRLVGVITHVRELAEQFPRIEVAKSPRGSRVAFVA